ncbi:MAG: GNAT family N-acetyltransferase [Betaproteobacteria bacterium]
MIDVRIRRATVDDAVAIARVRVESWRTTYRGMIPQSYLDSMTVEASATLWDKSLSAQSARSQVFVAEDAEGVLGFAAGVVLPEAKLGFDADLAAVYLRPAYQRLGLGSKLVGVTAAALLAQKAQSMVVWVIAANKAARDFYLALGAALVVEQPFQWDGMDLVEAGYGWRDLPQLVARCNAVTLH